MRTAVWGVLLFISLAVCSAIELETNDSALTDMLEAKESRSGGIIGMANLVQEKESQNRVNVPPTSKQVKIVGETAILATLRTFAEGDNLFSVTDEKNGHGMSFGTSPQTQDHIRMKPIGGGRGIAINSKADKVGLFVDATTGYVGVGHSDPKTHLHVQGTTRSSGTITTTASEGAGLTLSGTSDWRGIQFNTDGKGLYLIGRGRSLQERELSFHVPSAAEYGGGKEPKFKWVSGSNRETLAHLEASTGNMYVKGKLGIGATQPKAELDIRGNLNLANDDSEAIISFPRSREGGFHIRSTNNPGSYTTADDRFYIKGQNGFVGIRTVQPKTMLDVRGSMNLQDSSGAAVIYFPSKGKSASFFIRSADTPSQYSKEQERFYIGADGKVGVGTNSPSHGLTVSSEAAEGHPLNDVAILKGNLHLSGTIYSTADGGNKYFIDLKKDAFVKSVNVETVLGVGTRSPVSGSDAAVHILGQKPVLMVNSEERDGTATVTLQSGGDSWNIEGSSGHLRVKNNGKSRFTISADGKIGVGEQAENPQYGLEISTGAPVGDKRNDLSILKGDLWIGGVIRSNDNEKYSFSLTKGGIISDLNVEGRVGIGLKGEKPKFGLQLGEGQVMSIANQLFFASSDSNSYVSANAFRMANGDWKLFNHEKAASMIALDNTGKVIIAAVSKTGSTVMDTMVALDAASQTASFPMAGMKAGFGTSKPEYPIQVNGAATVGATQVSIAFGMTESSMGFLGSNEEAVYMATKSGKVGLSLNHHTGYVGIGTTRPQSALHISGTDSGASLSFGSSSNKGTYASISTTTSTSGPSGLDMVFKIKNPTKAGGSLTFDFSNVVKFGGSGSTVFERGDTIFATGNVAIGSGPFDSNYKLHVKGDMKVDGKCFVAHVAPPAPLASDVSGTSASTEVSASLDSIMKGTPSELDFSDLLEVAEGSTLGVSEHGIDLGETLHSLTRVLRKQHKQMQMHDTRMGELSAALLALAQRR